MRARRWTLGGRERPSGPRIVARWVAVTALWAALGAGALLVAAALVPPAFGRRAFVVMSGSMEPAVHTGDVVVDETVAPTRARVGDIVTFRDPLDTGRLITHRVRHVEAIGGLVRVETKGDANDTVEEWTVPVAGRIGKVEYRVPRIGYLLVWLRSPPGRLATIVLPAIALGALELRRIWRTPRTERDARALVG